ncbi:hypothetical protein TRFO_25540 [Tritrichomonas foetus]|uniref:Uncharacterized protein n=1 Tax=Tritrichomonas foetus TaxID=1144522 RepID=A0A1J4K9W2_9EUKA|nr:hypothetical protein TRFO_25540 [Tritrichomonas foetus]|eukprot:OHT06430.1 hypothetical protein TRFO_25540 [Tritrichomonas foetus]
MKPEECDTAISLFKRRGFLPDKEDRLVVLQHLQHKFIDNAMNGDYDTAQEQYDLNKKFLIACHKADENDMVYSRTDSIDAQIVLTKEQLSEAHEKWINKITEERMMGEQRIESMKNSHAIELDNFDKKWADVESLRSYAKPSKTLLALRSKEKKMILAKMYAPAKDIKAKADSLQAHETKEAQRRAQDDINLKRLQLLKQQMNQIDHIQQICHQNLQNLNKQKISEEKALRQRIENLERAKIAMSRPSTTMKAVSSISKGKPQNVLGMKSPRTIKRELIFRKSAPIKKLTLKPLNEFTKKGPRVKPRQVQTSQKARTDL